MAYALLGYIPLIVAICYLARRRSMPVEPTPLYDGTQPDWGKIEASEVWRSEIVPMLSALRLFTMEKLSKASIEDVPKLQAQVILVEQILVKPRQMVNLEAQINEREAMNGRPGYSERVRT